MAINKNHEFEELDGVKCGIVEKNVLADRVAFLKRLLEHNGFTVMVVPSPPAKVVAAKPAAVELGAEAIVAEPAALPAGPETFTVGVTDYTFNSINAIFGRLLRTTEGHVVTQAFWQQRESSSAEEIPYYANVAGK